MVEADILRGLECKSVVKVGSESVDCLARSQRPIRYRSNNESECPCTRKLKAGHTSPFTSVRIEKIGASDGRARLSCTAEGSAQTYSIYGLCGRGQPVGPVTALSSDGRGIAADRAAARPFQVLLCPGSYLVASNLEF